MSDCNTCQDCSEVPVGPVCPETPEYTNFVCPETPSSDCIIYEGGSAECLGIVSPSDNKLKITKVFLKIISYISNIFNRFTSNSLSITRSGECADILNIELIPSSDINNTLILGSDGKPFVKKVDTNISDSPCITWQKQVNGSIITFVPVIDFECVASKVCPICDGSVVPCPAVTINLTSITQTSVIIAFNQNGAYSYNLLVNNVQVATGISTGYSLTGLTAGTSYNISVVTDCGSGNTSQSIVSFTTLPLASCNLPSNLEITLV